jgi:hypothetical protein
MAKSDRLKSNFPRRARARRMRQTPVALPLAPHTALIIPESNAVKVVPEINAGKANFIGFSIHTA